MFLQKPPFFLIIFLIYSISTVHSQHIWPEPRHLSWPHPHFARYLSPTFKIISPIHTHLSPAITRYTHLILNEHHHPIITPTTVTLSSNSTPLTHLTLTISDLNSPLQHGVNESYTLTIPSLRSLSSANLTAETIWGAMRGLETFSQLVWGNPSRVAAGLYVSDSPIFEHRGLLLDTSRNYFDVEQILRTIEAMSYNKLNVFHWHVVDSHSFPLVLPSEPELAGKGAYGPDMRYSPEDVKRIVEFGFQHGVRVMPEIDSPGHTASWAEAYPEIITCANMFWADGFASEPGTGQLNPPNRKTYKVVKNIIHDVTTLFPETFYHAGADEINPKCWETDPSIQKFLANNSTLSELLEIFVNTTLPYITSLNRTAVYWEDVILDVTIKVNPSSLPPANTILQTWNNGPNNTKRIVSSGYRAIVSSSEFYYLDCGHGGFVGNDKRYDTLGSVPDNGGSWCGPFKTWQTIYDYDITYGLNETEAKLVIGGEVALWSEQADATVLDSRIWPRASAVAETLWSGNKDESGKKRYAEATDRLNEWRYRMVSRGIGAEPLQPLWCVTHPGMCNMVQ
ncbi:beta-N-acetylhexosaminidase [Ranunculus cassubicifolius]